MDEEERTGYGYMKSREYNLAPEEEKARKQMMELILLSSRFASSITVADGSDAEAAIEAFDQLFPQAAGGI